jgi:hypothetical protein
MSRLLKLTALIEAATGLGLIAVPSVVVRLLLGSPLETSAAVTLGRVAGAAVLSLGVACWLARGDTQSRAATGLVAAMLFYNVATVAVLTFAGIGFGLQRSSVVACGGFSRGDGRLVRREPAAQFHKCDGMIRS